MISTAEKRAIQTDIEVQLAWTCLNSPHRAALIAYLLFTTEAHLARRLALGGKPTVVAARQIITANNTLTRIFGRL